jgi:GNAT superfamily N-acetyltransferase
VWVDDTLEPALAVLRAGHRFYIAGTSQTNAAQQGVRDFFLEKIIPEVKSTGESGFLVDFSGEWPEGTATQVLRGCDIYPGSRDYYEIEIQAGMNWRLPSLDEFTIVVVNQALLDRRRLYFRKDLVEEMLSERTSVEDFLARSFGVCLLRSGGIAGWCLSEYNLAERCEIGIATAGAYQGRGLAKAQGAAFLSMAVARGIRRVGWHCWTDNAASGATARSLGLVKKNEYPAIFVHVP